MIKNFLSLLLKIFIVSIIFMIVYIISYPVFESLFGKPVQPLENVSPFVSLFLLFILCFSIVTVLMPFIIKSRLYGLKLIASVFIISSGIYILLNNIELVFFNGAVKMPVNIAYMSICAGGVSLLIQCPYGSLF
jgi:hypothetical protein